MPALIVIPISARDCEMSKSAHTMLYHMPDRTGRTRTCAPILLQDKVSQTLFESSDIQFWRVRVISHVASIIVFRYLWCSRAHA